MDSIHAQCLQMVDSPRFRQCQKLTRIFGIRARDREITMMHLINHLISRRFQFRPLVIFPSFRVCFFHIENISTPTIYTNGFGKDTWCLTIQRIILYTTQTYKSQWAYFTMISHFKGIITAFQVTFHLLHPDTISLMLQPIGLTVFHLSIYSLIDKDSNNLCIFWCKEFERRSLRGVGHLVEIKALSLSHYCSHCQ